MITRTNADRMRQLVAAIRRLRRLGLEPLAISRLIFNESGLFVSQIDCQRWGGDAWIKH